MLGGPQRVSEKKRLSYLYRESKHFLSVVQPVAKSVYRLSCLAVLGNEGTEEMAFSFGVLVVAHRNLSTTVQGRHATINT